MPWYVLIVTRSSSPSRIDRYKERLILTVLPNGPTTYTVDPIVFIASSPYHSPHNRNLTACLIPRTISTSQKPNPNHNTHPCRSHTQTLIFSPSVSPFPRTQKSGAKVRSRQRDNTTRQFRVPLTHNNNHRRNDLHVPVNLGFKSNLRPRGCFRWHCSNQRA